MALLRHPAYYGEDWWDWPLTRSRIYDQNFGMGILPEVLREVSRMDRMMDNMMVPYWARPARQDSAGRESGMSEVVNDNEKFQVNLDLSHFSPEEIQVKTLGNSLVVEGNHEEKQDEHGYISRHFSRRYMLPKGTDPATVSSKLSAEGVLTIEAPKKAIEAPPERNVPIKAEPKPAIEKKKGA